MSLKIFSPRAALGVNDVTVAAVDGAGAVLPPPPPQAVRAPDRTVARNRDERRDGKAGIRKC
jgi:hypothetical protein